jgi:hypothetical protein
MKECDHEIQRQLPVVQMCNTPVVRSLVL